MNVRQMILFLLGAGVCVLSFLKAEQPAGTFKEGIAVHSEWWPDRVKLVEDIDVDVNGSIKRLTKGRPAVFVRVEDGGALLDFGSYGVHVVPFASTNIPSLYAQNKTSRTWGDSKVLSSQLSNKFFWPATLKQIEPTTFAGVDYLLISYFDIGAELSGEGQEALLKVYPTLTEKCPSLVFLTIPMEDSKKTMLKDLDDSGIAWPVMFQHMSKGYVQALQHHPISPTVVLVDKNGRVLKKWGASKLKDASAFEADVEKSVEVDIARRHARND